MDVRTKIVNRLKTLKDIDGVEVKVNDEKKIIFVNFQDGQFLDFKFVWSHDQFVGYLTDADGNQKHAVISISDPLQAIHFVTAYYLLAGLTEGVEEAEVST
jgi:hypothetical protein